MSIPIHKKIEMIRSVKGLSQSAFSEHLGISLNTLKGIVKRGSSPRFDIIEAIANEWPEYAEWLLTGDKELNVEDEDILTRYRIIDSVDARYMDQCIIKSKFFKKLVFIQSKEIENDLAALLVVDADIMYRISSTPSIRGAVWIQPGNMNFRSEHGGKIVLQDFRNWIKSFNEDLILEAEIWALESKYFDDVYKQLHIPISCLSHLDKSSIIHKQFVSWKSGDKY